MVSVSRWCGGVMVCIYIYQWSRGKDRTGATGCECFSRKESVLIVMHACMKDRTVPEFTACIVRYCVQDCMLCVPYRVSYLYGWDEHTVRTRNSNDPGWMDGVMGSCQKP